MDIKNALRGDEEHYHESSVIKAKNTIAYFFAATTLAGALLALLFLPTGAPGLGTKAKTACVETHTVKTKSNNTRFIINVVLCCCTLLEYVPSM